MKYVLLSVAALVLCFGLSFFIAGQVRKRMKRKPPHAVHILICVAAGLTVIGAACAIFLNIHYKADRKAIAAFADSSASKVTKIDGGYFIDGKGEDTALVFYPGAKVDTDAYLPLMYQLADNCIDCFLLEMPFRMAIFNPNAADKVMGRYDYDTWLTAGHSMGGMIAASYAAAHESVDGVVLLAAYPTKQLPEHTALLSVYGTNDKVLDRGAYEKSKKYFPADAAEVVIEGGNHAQFANYGKQSGDGEATISHDEQQAQTVSAIIEYAENIKGSE